MTVLYAYLLDCFCFRYVERNTSRRVYTLLLFCIWHTQEDANNHKKNSCIFPACTRSKMARFFFSGWADDTMWYLQRFLFKIGLCLGWEILLDFFLSLHFLVFVMPEAARVTFRTLSARAISLVFFRGCHVCHLPCFLQQLLEPICQLSAHGSSCLLLYVP